MVQSLNYFSYIYMYEYNFQCFWGFRAFLKCPESPNQLPLSKLLMQGASLGQALFSLPSQSQYIHTTQTFKFQLCFQFLLCSSLKQLKYIWFSLHQVVKNIPQYLINKCFRDTQVSWDMRIAFIIGQIRHLFRISI